MITASNLTKNSTFTQASSYNTASISPTANNLILLVVVSNALSGTTNTPTVSGASMTWTQIRTFASSDSPAQRITVFRALSATPGSGVLTVSFGGQNQNHFTHVIDQFAGVVTSGTNGADAIVQSADKEQSSSSPSITLSALGNLNNAAYGAIFQNGTTTFTHGANFTQLGNTTAAYSLMSQWAINQTVIDWTVSNSNKLQMIEVEIKANLGGGASLLNFL